jgi:hypothetical protein
LFGGKKQVVKPNPSFCCISVFSERVCFVVMNSFVGITAWREMLCAALHAIVYVGGELMESTHVTKREDCGHAVWLIASAARAHARLKVKFNFSIYFESSCQITKHSLTHTTFDLAS